jgi:hypothetical protein
VADFSSLLGEAAGWDCSGSWPRLRVLLQASSHLPHGLTRLHVGASLRWT